MDAAKEMTATFVLLTYPLTVTKSGNGSGVVASTPAGINCGADCGETYVHGTVVTLTATADTGSTFVDWTGACTGGDPVCPVTMDAAKATTATFVLNTYPLTVTKSGNGSGVVTSTPAGIDCGDDCAETYGHGTVVTLTAAANTGSTFVDWTGACTGSDPVCHVTMDAAKAMTATFVVTTYPLTVIKSGDGDGDGVVASLEGGIVCGVTCTATYPPGRVVTLTVTADGTSAFTGWFGACYGDDLCTVTMDAAKEVTATFRQNVGNIIRTSGPREVGQTIVFTAGLWMTNMDVCTWDFGDGGTAPCELAPTSAGVASPQSSPCGRPMSTPRRANTRWRSQPAMQPASRG